MYSMRSGGGYQNPQGTTTTYYVPFDSNRTAQNNPSTQYSYVERRSTTSAPYNQNKTTTTVHYSTQSRRVNPALINNPNQPPRTPSAYHPQPTFTYKRDTRSEVDDSPIIDPSAFRYLNFNEKKSKAKSSPNDIESGIDSRPIINLDAVAKLERRRQQILEKNSRLRGDDGPKEGIDDRSIIDSNAFRYIEAKAAKSRKQGQGFDGGIDDRPIVNPNAFKYLDAKRQGKPVKQSNEPSIDTRPIINPDAFKYIEKRDVPIKRPVEGGIDSEPIVNPEAFRYLEKNVPSPRRGNVQSGVDTTSIVSPDAFQYIEKRKPVRPSMGESSVDYSPIVSPDAFKYIEKRKPVRPSAGESSVDDSPIVNPAAFKYLEQKQTSRRRVDNAPEIDERSYVNPNAFRYIDRNVTKRYDYPKSEIDTRSFVLDQNPNAFAHLERKVNRKNEMESGIDQRSYVDLEAFKYIEGNRNKAQNKMKYAAFDPSIDTRSYVDTEAFRHLENSPSANKSNAYDRDGIDERPFIPPIAFRHLDYNDPYGSPYNTNYFSFGQTDV